MLSRFDYGEADRILTLMTPAGGKVKAIAKGVRRQTSRIGGSLEPFAELRLADRKSTRLNSSHIQKSRMPSSA